MNIVKRKIKKREYYYLKYSYRKNGKVTTKEKYLGKEIPRELKKMDKELKKESKKMEKEKLDAIKKNFQKEWNKIPKSIQ